MKLLDDPIEPERPELPSDGNSLNFLQAVYRCDGLPLSTRMRAAVAALPFEHPKLAVTALISDQSFAAKLERAVLRSEQVRSQPRVIEGKAINDETKSSDGLKQNGDGLKTDLTLAPQIPDRRFRRRA